MNPTDVEHLVGSGSSSSVPVEHLDYRYIENCNKVKELEKIYRALKSGDHGIFTDLENFCEKKIQKLDPKNKILRKDRRPASQWDIEKEDWDAVHNDFKSWTNDIQELDKTLASTSLNHEGELPPVRGSATIDTKTGRLTKESSGGERVFAKPSKERIKSHDYRSWDKYNVDRELEKLDAAATARVEESLGKGRAQVQVEPVVDAAGMSRRERELKAEREREKGNESFRSSDFSEAKAYYSRSLSLVPSVAAYNNRALVEIRLEEFRAALRDCDAVVEMEPDNIKGHMRRAVAKKGLKDYSGAKQDLEFVLQKEPQNKKAEELIKELEKAAKKPANNKKSTETADKSSEGRRMVITEVEGSDSSQSESEPDLQTQNTNGEATPDTKSNVTTETEQNSTPGSGARVATSGTQENSAPGSGAKVGDKTEVSSPRQAVDTGWGGDPEPTSSRPAGPPTPEPSPPPPLPEAVVALKDAGNQLYKAGRYGEALEKYTKAINKLLPLKAEHGVSLSTLHCNRAACYSRTGDCKASLGDYSAAQRLASLSPKALLRRAAAYESLEKYGEAYVNYRQALSMDHTLLAAQEGSNRTTRHLIELDGPRWRDKLPGMPLSPSTSGGNIPPAGLANKTTTAAPPKSAVTRTEPTMEEKYLSLKDQGNNHFKKRNYGEAINSYSACIQLDPRKPVGYSNRAACYLGTDQPELAAKDCGKALELDPGNVKAMFRRAQAQKMQQRYREALQDLNSALKVDPGNKPVLKELDLVKDLYRKELRAMQETSKKEKAEPKTQRKKIPIQEVEGSSDEEEEESSRKTSRNSKAKQSARATASRPKSHPTNQPKAGPTPASQPKAEPTNQPKAGPTPASQPKSSPSRTSRPKADPTAPTIQPKAEPTTASRSRAGPTTTNQPKKADPAPASPPRADPAPASPPRADPAPASLPRAAPAPANSPGGPPKADQISSKKMIVEMELAPKTLGAGKAKARGGEGSGVKAAQQQPRQSTPVVAEPPRMKKASPYEFMQAWTSLKNTQDTSHYAKLLEQIRPDDLPQVLSNKLDGDMLLNIIKTLSNHYVGHGQEDSGYLYLSNLCKATRFGVVVLFMGDKDKHLLKSLFDKLVSRKSSLYSSQEVSQLKKTYQL